VGGLATPILATTSDGQPSFLRTNAHAPKTSSYCTPLVVNIRNRKDLLLKLLPDIVQAQDLSQLAKVLMKSASLLMGQADQTQLLVLTRPNCFEGTSYCLTGGDHVSKCNNEDIAKNPLLASALTSSQILNVNDSLHLPGFAVDNAILGKKQFSIFS